MRPLIYDPPVKLFISSRIAEFRVERRVLHDRINTNGDLQSHEAWVYEYAANVSGHKKDVYIGEVGASDVLVLLVGESLSEAVTDELDAARSQKKDVLVFAKSLEARPPGIQEFLDSLSERYQEWGSVEELWYCIFAAAQQRMRRLNQSASLSGQGYESSKITTIDVPAAVRTIATLVTSRLNEGRAAEALADIDQSISQTGPKDEILPDLHSIRGAVLRRMRRFSDAVEAHKLAVSLSDVPRFRVNLATTHFMADEVTEAREIFRSINEAQIDTPTYHILESRLAFVDKDARAALRGLTKARRLWRRRTYRPLPMDRAELYEVLGFACARLGRHGFAVQALEAAADCAGPLRALYLPDLARQMALAAGDRIDSSTSSRIEQLLLEAQAEIQPSMISSDKAERELGESIANVRALVALQRRDYEAVRALLRPVAEGSTPMTVTSYNYALAGYLLDGSPMPVELIEAMAMESNDDSLLLNVTMPAVVAYLNKSGTREEAIDSVERHERLFPDSDSLSLLKADLAMADGEVTSAETPLRSLICDPRAKASLRVDAAAHLYVGLLNFGRLDEAGDLFALAGAYGLCGLEMIGQEIGRIGRGNTEASTSYSVAERVEDLLAQMPKLMRVERRSGLSLRLASARMFGRNLMHTSPQLCARFEEQIVSRISPLAARQFREGVAEAAVV